MNLFRLLLWFALRGKGCFLVHYKMMQVFLSLNGFSEVGMPISRGSLRACSSQYDIRSADALETFILSMEASNLSCCTVLLAWAVLLVLAVLLDIFDDSSFLKSARLCVGQCLQVLNGRVNQKSQLQIEKMLTPMSFPYELSAVAAAAVLAAATAAAWESGSPRSRDRPTSPSHSAPAPPLARGRGARPCGRGGFLHPLRFGPRAPDAVAAPYCGRRG